MRPLKSSLGVKSDEIPLILIIKMFVNIPYISDYKKMNYLKFEKVWIMIFIVIMTKYDETKCLLNIQ